MDQIDGVYKNTGNEEDKEETPPQIEDKSSDEVQERLKPDNKTRAIKEPEQQKPSTPMRKSNTNYNVET